MHQDSLTDFWFLIEPISARCHWYFWALTLCESPTGTLVGLEILQCASPITDKTGIILSYHKILLKLAGCRQHETKPLQGKMTLAEQSCAGNESWPLHSKTIIWVWASVVSKLPAAQRLLPFCVTQLSDMFCLSCHDTAKILQWTNITCCCWSFLENKAVFKSKMLAYAVMLLLHDWNGQQKQQKQK